MYTEYKRDMNHNYLILHSEQEIDTSSYQVRMLAGNVLPSVLRCRLQRMDGQILFYYEITSRQSLLSFYEQKKFRKEDLQLIFGGLIKAMEEMGEYLLNPGHLLLEPEYIFLDVEKKNLYFCYLPGYSKELGEQIRTFIEYLLPSLDHDDEGAVMLGYGIYRRVMESNFHLEHMKEELYQIRTEDPVQKEPSPDLDLHVQESVLEKDTEEETFSWEIPEKKKPNEEPEKKRKITGKIMPVVIGISAAVLIMGLLATNILGYLPWLNVEMTLGISCILLGAALFCYFISARKRKQDNRKHQAVQRQEQKQEEMLYPAPTERREISDEENTRKQSKEIFTVRTETGKTSNGFGETVVLSAGVSRGPASLVSREPGELATIYLKEELTIIGKLEMACDYVIPMSTVSRVHAKIRKKGEQYYLSDLNSRNGTSVNGKMLTGGEEYLLQDEDEIDLAQARYIFLK